MILSHKCPEINTSGHFCITYFEKLGLECIAQCKRKIQGDDLVISHCNNLPLASELRDKAREMFDFGRIIILETKGLTSLYACDKGIILSF